MEDQTTVATDSGNPSNNIEPPIVVEAADPQTSAEAIITVPETNQAADPVQSVELNTDALKEVDPVPKNNIQSADQTLDRDQEQLNSAVIVENSEKNDDTSSTTSDDSDDESSSSSMHLCLNDKKSKMHDLDEDEDPADNKPIRSTNELKELPPEEPVYDSINVNDQISLLGEVTHYVDEFIVIRSNMDTPTVDIDSVLCLEDRTVLGRVHETFGRVDNPLYSVRMIPLVTRVKEEPTQAPAQETLVTESVNHVTATEVSQTTDSLNGNGVSDSSVKVSAGDQPEQSVQTDPTVVTPVNASVAPDVTSNTANDTSSSANDVAPAHEKKEHNFKKPNQVTPVKRPPPPKGTKVYYVSKFSKVLSSWRDVYSKGYDASNEHDEEVPEDELEFSDDEKEAEAKRLAKSKRKKPQQSGETAVPSEDKKRPRKRAKHVANESAAMTPVTPTPPYAPQPPGPYYPMAYPAPWPQPYVAGPYAPQFVAPMPGYAPNTVPYPTHINYYAPYPPNLHPPTGRGRGNVNQSFVFTNPPNQQQQ